MILWFILGVLLIALILEFLCGMTHIRFYKRQKPGTIRVACVGDSITYGCYIPFFFARNYPAQLQKLLGPGYTVDNYGKSNRTLQPDGNRPYSRGRVWQAGLTRGADIVIIMLGTNDSKACNWKGEAAFRQAYEHFICQYEKAYPGCRIILCTPPRVGKPLNLFALISNACENEPVLQMSAVIRSIAAQQGRELADMNRLTQGCDDLFCFDHLHTNHRGAKAMAKLLKEIVDNGNPQKN